jgi:tartrate dehydrogenase/decarboxylase/D-malate dehydrogenase
MHKIALIPCDGIGKEVLPEVRRVLEHIAPSLTYEEFPWGSDYFFQHGRMMPADALDTLRRFDAILLGAVGDPRIQDHQTLNGLLLPIRRTFDQYACVRPAYYYPGTRSPLAKPTPGSIDFVVIRENTEGEYANVGGHVYQGMKDEVAVQTAVFTRHGTERVIRFAFELAAKRPIKKLTSVTKSNAQGYGMVFWDRVFREVAEEFSEVTTESLLVDAACMDLVRRPEEFDVIVASNLFGDILTDIAAIITGSMGLAPSANLNPSREFPSMFEPVHGSAPDIASKSVANPLAAILSATMMLDFLGEADGGAKIQTAVRAVLAEGKATTGDLGGTATTRQCADGVIARLAK